MARLFVATYSVLHLNKCKLENIHDEEGVYFVSANMRRRNVIH